MSEPEPGDRGSIARIGAGAGWGALGGLLLALLIARKLPRLGYYGGDQVLLFAVCLGLGAAIGAGIMRLRRRADGRPPR